MTRCPVCNARWAAAAPPERCACGYELESRDPRLAVVLATEELSAANRRWRRGLLALLLVPVTFAFLVVSVEALAGVVTATQMLLGLLASGVGIAQGHVARNRLRAAQQLMQLPPARVL